MPSAESRNLKSVKFRFANIGPIKRAELQLADLTIIAGRNNTGKTYLVYTLYGFLKMWQQWPGILSGDYEGAVIAKSDMENIAESAIEEGSATFSTSPEQLNLEREHVIKHIAKDFSEDSLSMVFSSKHESFTDASIDLLISPKFPQTRSTTFYANRLSGEFHYDDGQLSLTAKSPNRTRTTREPFPIQTLIADMFYTGFLFPELSIEPFVLSAERFGISLFYRELDFTKNQLVDMLQKLADDKDRDRFSPFLLIDRTTSRYALPIKDNIDYTRSIPDIRNEKSSFYESKIFDDIRNIMGGYYKAGEDDISFISKARGPRRFEIPLHIASSSARGLSDLYFFLRHVAHENHLLIIDEPESHLDTANQRLLARLLAKLVKIGLKIIVTTHSDYLVKEINNLVMLSNEFDGKDSVVNDLGYGTDDSLVPESVRAYIAEDGGLTECSIDKFGIDMPVFDETIDDINRASNEIASRLYEDN